MHEPPVKHIIEEHLNYCSFYCWFFLCSEKTLVYIIILFYSIMLFGLLVPLRLSSPLPRQPALLPVNLSKRLPFIKGGIEFCLAPNLARAVGVPPPGPGPAHPALLDPPLPSKLVLSHPSRASLNKLFGWRRERDG